MASARSKAVVRAGSSKEGFSVGWRACSKVGSGARFKYVEAVQKWLNLLRGAYTETITDDLRLGTEKPVLPFADVRLLQALRRSPQTGAARDGRAAPPQNHYPLVRQAHDGRFGEAVDGHPDAPQLVQPGNLFPGRLPRANPLDRPRPASAPCKTSSGSWSPTCSAKSPA